MKQIYFALLLGLVLLHVIPSGRLWAQNQELRVSSIEAPLSQDEIMTRVRAAYAKAQDVDDIAADIDRRGIGFQLDSAFARKIQFFRGSAVTNALYRADDRRKALSLQPKNPATLEDLTNGVKPEVKDLPFIEQARLINQAYVESLPNYVVHEQVQRYYRQGGAPWKLNNYLDIEVTYTSDKGEQMKLKQENGSSTNVSLEQLGGLTSSGQFAGLLASIFKPESKTEFSELGKTEYFGRPCVTYAYRVATKNSKYQLRCENAQTITGYQGKIFLDRDTRQVVRLEQEAFDIPSDFPLTAASSVVDFGWVALSGKDFFLPVSSQVSLTSKQNKMTALNSILFTKYGKFETDVKIVND
ncbi:MAG: hypothetical protein K1Y36_15375 [Blastocatellia bacterium]|nr:hypothetical protein [Blastocatellia bacterium]